LMRTADTDALSCGLLDNGKRCGDRPAL